MRTKKARENRNLRFSRAMVWSYFNEAGLSKYRRHQRRNLFNHTISLPERNQFSSVAGFGSTSSTPFPVEFRDASSSSINLFSRRRFVNTVSPSVA